MSQEALERLLGRLLTDDMLRGNAFHSIEGVCKSVGFELNPSELKAINREDLVRIELVSQQLDKSIKRFSVG